MTFCRFYDGMRIFVHNDLPQEGPLQPGGRLAGVGERPGALHPSPGGHGSCRSPGSYVIIFLFCFSFVSLKCLNIISFWHLNFRMF